MNYPQQAAGYQRIMRDYFSEVVTPGCFNRGGESEFRQDSRLKHTGMTHFYNGMNSTQQAAGNRRD
jgi:hypothetical protein